jgi:hypothetical protein
MDMDISICSYSFHRLLGAGKQDIFQYITDCKNLGCTLLDPWNGHFVPIRETDKSITPDSDLKQAAKLTPAEVEYIDAVARAGKASGLPFGNIAVDGAHIYEPTPEARAVNRARADRYLELCRRLGARQMRIDAGGPEQLTDDILAIIVEGYNDLIARARKDGIEIVIENHWGPGRIPDNIVCILEAVPGLGFLYDSFNWKPELTREGREKTARYATATHFKTFEWDENGNETTQDLPTAINLLKQAGYKGCWGIESTPKTVDEMTSARLSVEYIKKLVG